MTDMCFNRFVNVSVTKDGMALVTLCIRYCMSWSDWSDTRWLQSGQSARRYIRSLLLGADRLVQLVLQDTACYHLWLKCHAEKSSDDVRLFS